jgi:competence protein ComEA
MPELDDAGPFEPLPRPPPDPAWRDLLDLDRLLGGRPVVPVVGGVLVVVAVLAGAAWFLLRPPPLPPIEASLPMAGSTGSPGATAITAAVPSTAATELVVHAAGAVSVPGIHHLPAGSRVADLLAAAGGPTPDADLDRVNLAAVLADGAQVRFPRLGEPVQAVPAEGATAPSTPAGPIDLNTATTGELEGLPGVGPTIAAAIVEHREQSGPFRSVEDLLDVPGIGPARLDQLRDAVTV